MWKSDSGFAGRLEISNLFWLTNEQMERLRPFSPESHRKARFDGCRVWSGIIFVNRNGLRWRDALRGTGFRYETHQQSLAVAATEHAHDDQAFVDAVADWGDE